MQFWLRADVAVGDGPVLRFLCPVELRMLSSRGSSESRGEASVTTLAKICVRMLVNVTQSLQVAEAA